MELLNKLDIVGYADVLDEQTVPHVVAPIFRLRDDPERLLFPPFRLSGPVVVEATVGSNADMQSLVARGEATRLSTPVPAQPDHELWIDQGMQARYEPFTQADENLRQIAFEAIEQARTALREGNPEDADRLCTTAMAADDRLPEPLVIKAAIYRMGGDTDREEAMRTLAALNYTEEGFDELVGLLIRNLSDGSDSEGCNKLKGIAILRPAA